MAWFSKKPKDEPAADAVSRGVVDEAGPASDDDLGPDHTGRPVSRALDEAEHARIDAALAQLATEGVDVDDLDAIGAAFDAAYATWRADPEGNDSGRVVETYAIAIGEHLARHSAREWAVVTDVFGTDLGLVAARADTVIVPHNLVGARWMRGDRGWIPGVVSHLVRMRPRS